MWETVSGPLNGLQTLVHIFTQFCRNYHFGNYHWKLFLSSILYLSGICDWCMHFQKRPITLLDYYYCWLRKWAAEAFWWLVRVILSVYSKSFFCQKFGYIFASRNIQKVEIPEISFNPRQWDWTSENSKIWNFEMEFFKFSKVHFNLSIVKSSLRKVRFTHARSDWG